MSDVCSRRVEEPALSVSKAAAAQNTNPQSCRPVAQLFSISRAMNSPGVKPAAKGIVEPGKQNGLDRIHRGSTTRNTDNLSLFLPDITDVDRFAARLLAFSGFIDYPVPYREKRDA